MEIEGVLEIDHARGVIYFHTYYGETLLRICSLPKPIPNFISVDAPTVGDFLDITHMNGCSWEGKHDSD